MSILVYNCKHGQTALSYAWKANGEHIVEVRIYRKTALDFERPKSAAKGMSDTLKAVCPTYL